MISLQVPYGDAPAACCSIFELHQVIAMSMMTKEMRTPRVGVHKMLDPFQR